MSEQKETPRDQLKKKSIAELQQLLQNSQTKVEKVTKECQERLNISKGLYVKQKQPKTSGVYRFKKKKSTKKNSRSKSKKK